MACKYLFLDIDGVLNSKEYENKCVTVWISQPLDPSFDKDCIARLNKIIEETGATIVLSSSWRFYMDETRNRMKNSGFSGELEESISGIEDVFRDPESRGKLIDQYLKEHSGYESYVILDDTDSFLDKQSEHIVLTDYKVGLTEENVKQIINILGKRND